jgi:hypothetical protein
MAVKDFYHDLDLKLVSQFLNARTHNVTTAQRTTLGSSLNGTNKGLHVWDTDLSQTFHWTGTAWTNGVATITGAMTYKGAYDSLNTTPADAKVGDMYSYTGVAGALTWSGQTFLPSGDIEPGDTLVYRGENAWDVLQGNVVPATTSAAGVLRLATSVQAIAGESADTAITPETLKAVHDAKKMPRVFFDGAISLLANTPFTVEHNLNLQNKDAFTIRVADSTGSDVSVDVDSVSVNSLSINSAIAATNVKVTVIGY